MTEMTGGSGAEETLMTELTGRVRLGQLEMTVGPIKRYLSLKKR